MQGIVRLCSDFNVPVWYFSVGRNTGYGGAAPRISGSVCLDLGKHMDRIIHVNFDDVTALLDPGVIVFDMYEYLGE